MPSISPKPPIRFGKIAIKRCGSIVFLFAPLPPCGFALSFSYGNYSSGTPLCHSGGISRAIRRKSDDSAASAELPADTKCQFSALLPCSRQSFRRINVQIMQNLRIFRIFCNKNAIEPPSRQERQEFSKKGLTTQNDAPNPIF